MVGFSGGADSLALVVALARLGGRGPRVLAVHVDHGLRPGSAAEARRAGGIAGSLGVAFEVRTLEPALASRHPGVGIEEAARRERYRALAQVAAVVADPPALVVTAHHQDDQAETVLLHLLRGAGVHGAAAMAERRDLLVPWWSAPRETGSGTPPTVTTPLRLWRPLLGERRSTLAAYRAAVAPGTEPVDDDSNRDQRLGRNAIRLGVLPVLERRWPGAVGALSRYAALAAEDDALLDTLAETAIPPDAADNGLRLADLRCLSPALARRVLRRWLTEQTGGAELPAERVDAVLSLVRSGRGGWRLEIGGNWSVAGAGGAVRVDGPPTFGQ